MKKTTTYIQSNDYTSHIVGQRLKFGLLGDSGSYTALPSPPHTQIIILLHDSNLTVPPRAASHVQSLDDFCC